MRDYEEIERYKKEHPKQKVQTIQEGFQERFTRSNCDVTFGGGVLSPQPYYSKVLTPHGYVTIESLNAGDIVLGLGGELQKITHNTPQGMQECIRITLEDGSSAESAMSHRWWILHNGAEENVISFELLEAYEASGGDPGFFMFKVTDGITRPVRVSRVESIGQVRCNCIGVSGEAEIYITDCGILTKNCGKAQPFYSKVLTPTGFRNMGSLKVGDVINDPSGGTQVVEAIFDKGERHVYRVVFEGNAEVHACAEHMWYVYDIKERKHTHILTEDLAKDVKRYLFPCCAPQEFDYNIEPRGRWTAYEWGRIMALDLDNDYVPAGIRRDLLAHGIIHSAEISLPKWIGKGKLQTRLDYIRGLMDGLAEKYPDHQSFPYPRRAVLFLQFIVESIGGFINWVGDYKGMSTVSMVVPELEALGNTINRGRSNAIYRRIQKVTLMVKTFPCLCIQVSAPHHLYITNYFIVTHNTYAAILMVAEPSTDSRFRGAFTRRNLGNLKQGGGIVDDFRNAYGDFVDITTSDNPRVTFPSGAYIDCLHIANEEPVQLMERAKGWQYDLFYMDELTSYEFSTFSIVGTRVRGKSAYTGHIRGTTNPKKSHWTRKMLDWYVGLNGFIDPERDGVVRYYYQMGDQVIDLVWGSTPEEVYQLCKSDIDRKLRRLDGEGWDYRNLVRSFVFYAGKMAENKAMVENNANYVGAVTAVGGKRSQQLIEGNWNVDEDESDDIPIPSRDAQAVFTNDECRTGDHWITVDLADVGTDNVLALEWDGFHVVDMLIIEVSTPRMNYEKIATWAKQRGIGESHIIYDATRATYMYDYMPNAVGFISAASAVGVDSLRADRLKDECYLRLVSMINRGDISFSEDVARRTYNHQNIKNPISVQTEFLEECEVVRFRDKSGYGKIKLLSKKEMNAALGRSRSMDLLDACAMRMLPILRTKYGEENGERETNIQTYAGRGPETPTSVSIYDDSLYC